MNDMIMTTNLSKEQAQLVQDDLVRRFGTNMPPPIESLEGATPELVALLLQSGRERFKRMRKKLLKGKIITETSWWNWMLHGDGIYMSFQLPNGSYLRIDDDWDEGKTRDGLQRPDGGS